jgi:hypothetical protein
MSHRIHLPLATFLVLSCALQAGHGQRKSDPQSAYEPRSGPGAGQKFLERMAGDRDVAKTFYPRSGEPSRTRGECRQTMIQEGRFLESAFVFTQDGAKTTGLGLIGFEPGSGKFTSVWIDSRQTRMSLRHSKEPFNGTEIVLYSAELEPSAEGRSSRTNTRIEEDGRKTLHRQYAVGADGKDRLMMELDMMRKR